MMLPPSAAQGWEGGRADLIKHRETWGQSVPAQQGHQVGSSTQPRAAGTPVGTALGLARCCNPGVPGIGAVRATTKGDLVPRAQPEKQQNVATESGHQLRASNTSVIANSPKPSTGCPAPCFWGWIAVSSLGWANSAPWPGCRRGLQEPFPSPLAKGHAGIC